MQIVNARTGYLQGHQSNGVSWADSDGYYFDATSWIQTDFESRRLFDYNLYTQQRDIFDSDVFVVVNEI